MNIYHVNRLAGTGYEEYSDFVVVAASEDEARRTCPNQYCEIKDTDHPRSIDEYCDSWPVSFNEVEVTLIGVAIEKEQEKRIVCASYHAG